MWFETTYIWQNWKFIEWNDSIEHTVNHTLHYGWWVFEGIRFYDTDKWPKVFRLKEHIERLYYSANVFNLTIPYTKEELIDATLELVKKNLIENWYIRPIVYLWYWKMWLNPKWLDTNVSISLWKWWRYLSDLPISVKIPKIRRISNLTTDMSAKVTWNYANSILASNEIHSQWFDEWLLLDIDWNIAEWPWENIFFVKWEQVYTPKLWNILPWITRDTIIKLFKDKFDTIVIESIIKPSEIMFFDEAFFVWTAAEVTPIWSITLEDWTKKDFVYDENSFTMKMHDLYLDLVKWKISWYDSFLY